MLKILRQRFWNKRGSCFSKVLFISSSLRKGGGVCQAPRYSETCPPSTVTIRLSLLDNNETPTLEIHISGMLFKYCTAQNVGEGK